MSAHEFRRLVLRCLLFLLPLAVAAAAVEGVLATVPSSYTIKADAVRRSAGRVAVLLLGSSHVLNGIDPDALGVPAVNLGNSSQSIELDVALAEKYLRELPRLRLIVIEMGYHSLGDRLENEPEAWRRGFYVRAFGVHERPGLLHELDPLSHSLLLSYGALETQRLLSSAEARRGPALTADGWQPIAPDSVAFREREAGRHRAAWHASRRVPAVVEDDIAALRHLLRTAAGRGARVAFVTLPVTAGYREGMNRVQWSGDQRRIREIAAACGASYHDFLADARFGDADFRDNDHLDAGGARRFTSVLAAEVVQPALDRGAPAQCEGRAIR